MVGVLALGSSGDGGGRSARRSSGAAIHPPEQRRLDLLRLVRGQPDAPPALWGPGTPWWSGVNSSEEVSMNYSDGATQHPDRVPAILRVQAPLSPLCGGPETCCLPR